MEKPLKSDNPVFSFITSTQPGPKMLKWCPQHWVELMTALRDQGLDDKIAATAAELDAKFIRGESDPCWEACNAINIGALEIFGPDRIMQVHNGCPVCAFARMTHFVVEQVTLKFGSVH